MSKSEKIYKRLSKHLSDEEIVDGYVFNDDSTSPEEQEAIDKEFRELRMKRLSEMTDSEQLFGKLMKIKYRMQDYFESSSFDKTFSFSQQLRQYSKIIKRTNKEFAKDLNLHHTKLSRILNNKENPSVELMYRLEEHSNGELPAHYWWRLYSREFESKIVTDLKKRAEESNKVTNRLAVKAETYGRNVLKASPASHIKKRVKRVSKRNPAKS